MRVVVLDRVRAVESGLFYSSLSVHGDVRRKERGGTVESITCFFFIFESVNHLTKLLALSCP